VTLRFRLVAALVVLMATGLAIFGFTMYGLYSRSQYNQLQGELENSVPLVTHELAEAANVRLPVGNGQSGEGPGPATGPANPGGDGPVPGGPGGGPGQETPQLIAPGTYGELVGKSGRILASTDLASVPRVRAALLAANGPARLVHLGSVTGSTGWLTYIGPRLANGDRVLVALPTTSVTNSLHRLVLFEVLGATSLLLILSAGAGLVLRRGLAPLERMADTAKDIAAGDLGQRVVVADQGTEVAQLAVAFNTMLDEIQQAFAARDDNEARLRQFLADASHELRTPLTSIQGFAELFRLGRADARVDTDTIMRRIEEESARMKTLVEDLLLLARVDQVRRNEPAAVDLSVLAADACSDAIAASPNRSVTLDAPEPVVILGDEAHLRQAIANLVTNALRHTAEGSAIEVAARLAGGAALVQVRDHGPGLDDHALAHVFDRFWQKDPARVGAGAGLGLAIVSAIAAEHGGKASAANAPGGGAVFSLLLPLVAGPPQGP
jgi:two-component system OmpR family sensor kinase